MVLVIYRGDYTKLGVPTLQPDFLFELKMKRDDFCIILQAYDRFQNGL